MNDFFYVLHDDQTAVYCVFQTGRVGSHSYFRKEVDALRKANELNNKIYVCGSITRVVLEDEPNVVVPTVKMPA